MHTDDPHADWRSLYEASGDEYDPFIYTVTCWEVSGWVDEVLRVFFQDVN